MNSKEETSQTPVTETSSNTSSPTVSSPLVGNVTQKMNLTPGQAALWSLVEDRPPSQLTDEELLLKVEEWRTLATSAQTLRASLARREEKSEGKGEKKTDGLQGYLNSL